MVLVGSATIFYGGSTKKSLQSDIFCWGLGYKNMMTLDMLCLTCPNASYYPILGEGVGSSSGHLRNNGISAARKMKVNMDAQNIKVNMIYMYY